MLNADDKFESMQPLGNSSFQIFSIQPNLGRVPTKVVRRQKIHVRLATFMQAKLQTHGLLYHVMANVSRPEAAPERKVAVEKLLPWLHGAAFLQQVLAIDDLITSYKCELGPLANPVFSLELIPHMLHDTLHADRIVHAKGTLPNQAPPHGRRRDEIIAISGVLDLDVDRHGACLAYKRQTSSVWAAAAAAALVNPDLSVWVEFPEVEGRPTGANCDNRRWGGIVRQRVVQQRLVRMGEQAIELRRARLEAFPAPPAPTAKWHVLAHRVFEALPHGWGRVGF